MLSIHFTENEEICIKNNQFLLCGPLPLLNDQPVSGLSKKLTHCPLDPQGCFKIEYFSPELKHGSMGIQIELSPDRQQCWLRYWLENPVPGIKINSFGIQFRELTGVDTILKNGYHSWDGSGYVQWHSSDKNTYTGYAMTQILSASRQSNLTIGFDRHERFQHQFIFENKDMGAGLSILTLWDQKTVEAGQLYESERLVLIEHNQVESGLQLWSQIVADNCPTRPALPPFPLTGWSSWYNYYAAISEASILQELQAAREIREQLALDLRIFQLDDGFTLEMGDWLEVKPQFPNGIPPILQAIRSAGFIPGLWIAPFMVGNRSHLYQNHPDWVVQDRLSGGPLAHMKFYGEFRWHKRSEEYYILDVTHPEALDYLRTVFSTWHTQWGCDYFKTDFMYFGSEYGPERASYHQPGYTRIEIWRKAAETIRSAIGNALWTGCGCPLWASVGLVNAVRISRDMGVSWRGEQSAYPLLADHANRSFGNHILWQIDPDCLLLREKFHHFSDAEIEALALYAGMSGGILMTSDSLNQLPLERLQLLKFLHNQQPAKCHFPFLGSGVNTNADPILVQVRQTLSAHSMEQTAVLFFNTSDEPAEQTYTIRSFGINLDNVYIFEWQTQQGNPHPQQEIRVRLEAHSASLFFLGSKPFHEAPKSLP
ncbi:MAG: hypothetical protein CVU39_00965 [Chloroflexi bacterium HGW-Chloroflexi-10]|nr:MAG: hypothetical protein CVU39_00965 [Chloroflexi bacterium HGW-Chloroflexi-10]